MRRGDQGLRDLDSALPDVRIIGFQHWERVLPHDIQGHYGGILESWTGENWKPPRCEAALNKMRSKLQGTLAACSHVRAEQRKAGRRHVLWRKTQQLFCDFCRRRTLTRELCATAHCQDRSNWARGRNCLCAME